MIYAPKQRVLDDGCIACNSSETYCDSLGEHARCCQMCSHRPAPADPRPSI